MKTDNELIAEFMGMPMPLVKHHPHDTIDGNALRFLTSTADVTFHTLKEGIEYLRTFR